MATVASPIGESLSEPIPEAGESTDRTCQVLPTSAVKALERGYTYTIPAHLDIAPGSLVLVDLHGGIRKGIVMAVDVPRPEKIALKPVLAVYPGGPLMTSHQLELSRWLAHFYRASVF